MDVVALETTMALVGDFSHCCDRILGKSTLDRRQMYLGSWLRVESVMVGRE